ncbi:polyketide cyclase [Sphingobacteriaceae bacterium]|nr:polyketide cyclase [Sphingobacteriaceae bacterium]
MEAKNENELVITRTINGPRDLIFKAFTEAEHLKHWWGPVGFELKVITLDVREGGTFHYSMKDAKGQETFGLFKYKKINAPESIEFTNGFADKDGNLIKNAFLPVFPLEVYNIWKFTEENGKTILSLRGTPYNASAEEEKAFADMHAGMNQGFGGTFDQLETYLKTL